MSDAPQSEVVVRCPKCKGPLVNVLGSALCAGGCGGKYPAIPADEHNKNRQEVRAQVLPLTCPLRYAQACEKGNFSNKVFYVIDQTADLWRRVARPSPSLENPPVNGILARLEDKQVIALVPDHQANAVLQFKLMKDPLSNPHVCPDPSLS